jgi:hypothetical protein
MNSRRVSRMLAATMAALILSGVAVAQTSLLQEVRTISSGAEPVEHALDITQGGAYQLTLTDLKVPAALTSVKLAITSDTTVIGTTATTASSATSVLDFNAIPGSFVIRIVGKPAAGSSGSVGVKVTRTADSAVIQEFVAAIAAPPAAVPDNRATLDATFTPASTGTYEVVLSDLGLPEAIPNLILSVTRVGGSLVATLPGAGTTSFAGDGGAAYKIVALAEASSSVNAGLFGVRVRDAATANTVFSRTVTVGRVEQLGSAVLSAGTYTLSLADFQFPAPLTQSGVALSLDGQIAALASRPGTVDFTATAGEHVIYAYALATAAGSGTGSYGVEVRPQNGAPLFSTVKTVGGSTGTSTAAYSFVVDVATAGAYRVRLADFNFPAPFTGSKLAAAQSGVLLGSLDAPGALNLANVAVGRLFLVVLAQPAAVAGGLFGVDVTPAGAGATIFEATQGVGNLSTSRKVSVSAAARYRVKVTDVQFPAAFGQFSAIVTRGADTSVAIFGSDQFDFAATPGNYLVNFIAQPDPAENAGTYGLQVTQLPPAATVTLTATPTQANVGGTVELKWSSTDATTCTASGGWLGAKDTSGTLQSPPIAATTSFTLKCDGPGGSATQTVTVNAVTQSNSGGGGGGALGWLAILGLALTAAARAVALRRGSHRPGIG